MRVRFPLLVLAVALVLEAFAAGAAHAEVIPSWRAGRDVLVLWLVGISVGGGLLAWLIGLRRKVLGRGGMIAGGLLCLLLLFGGWLALFLRTSDDWGMRSRRLVQSVVLSDAEGELYVYEYEGVPDGFEGSVVMIRMGSLPVMRPLVTARYSIGRIEQGGGRLRLFSEGTDERESLNCELATQSCR
jgi:hypothetical protein